MEKFTQLTKILHDRWSRRSRQISSLVGSLNYKQQVHSFEHISIPLNSLSVLVMFRLGICRDHRDRRSCKIFVSCVNFSRKQRSFLHILQVYTHLNVNFLTHFVQFLPKTGQIKDNDAFLLLFLAKIVLIHAFSVCKILLPENLVV